MAKIKKSQIEPLGASSDVSPLNLSWGESYINNWRSKVLDDGATYFPNIGGYELGKLHQENLNPSLVLLPAAVKTSTLYVTKGSANFEVDRNSIATYVDEDGIIRTAPIDVARIDYSNGGDGVVLKEPQSTNIYLNNAILVTQDVTTLADTYTVSFYGTGTITFSNSFVGSLVGTGVNDRVTLTFTATAGTLTSTVTGSVLDSQCENLPIATSVIFTTGSSETRLIDKIINAGTVSDFNSEEGTLLWEGKSTFTVLGAKRIRLYDSGNINNRIEITFQGANEFLFTARFQYVVNNVIEYQHTEPFDISINNKIAFTWKLNDFSYYLNGVLINNSLIGNVNPANSFDSFNFDKNGVEEFTGPTKQLQVYKRALTLEEINKL